MELIIKNKKALQKSDNQYFKLIIINIFIALKKAKQLKFKRN